jgi:hypothetical protein
MLKVYKEMNIEATGKYLVQYFQFGILHCHYISLDLYSFFKSVSGVTHHKNGKARSALQFLIDYCKEHGILLATGLTHPCRTGMVSNCLPQAEVDAFLKLCYKMMAHHCFFGKSTKVQKGKGGKCYCIKSKSRRYCSFTSRSRSYSTIRHDKIEMHWLSGYSLLYAMIDQNVDFGT